MAKLHKIMMDALQHTPNYCGSMLKCDRHQTDHVDIPAGLNLPRWHHRLILFHQKSVMGNTQVSDGEKVHLFLDLHSIFLPKDEIFYIILAAAKHLHIDAPENQIAFFAKKIRREKCETAKLLRAAPLVTWSKLELPQYLKDALMDVVGSPLAPSVPRTSSGESLTDSAREGQPAARAVGAAEAADVPPEYFCPITREVFASAPLAFLDACSLRRLW